MIATRSSLAIIKEMPSEEFERLRHDPDLQAIPGPGRTLIFEDGGQFWVVGPDFVSMEESDCYGFGETIEQALANYALKSTR